MICKTKKVLKRFCCEDISLIENYKLAVNSNEQYDCHHRLEIQEDGVLLSMQQLKDMNLYYHRPASELIFLSHKEHMRLHALYISDETRQKRSESQLGEKNHRFGKKMSPENILKQSERMLGNIPWNKGKSVWSNEHNKMISEKCKGYFWWNNGVIEIKSKTCPDGFIRGRIYSRKK